MFQAYCRCGWRQTEDDKRTAEIAGNVHEDKHVRRPHSHDVTLIVLR